MNVCLCVYSVFLLSCVQVAASRQADHSSKESYRLGKRDYITEEEARAQQRAVEPLMNELVYNTIWWWYIRPRSVENLPHGLMLVSCWLILRAWRWRRLVPPKYRSRGLIEICNFSVHNMKNGGVECHLSVSVYIHVLCLFLNIWTDFILKLFGIQERIYHTWIWTFYIQKRGPPNVPQTKLWFSWQQL
jgi:hypothetical protein